MFNQETSETQEVKQAGSGHSAPNTAKASAAPRRGEARRAAHGASEEQGNGEECPRAGGELVRRRALNVGLEPHASGTLNPCWLAKGEGVCIGPKW